VKLPPRRALALALGFSLLVGLPAVAQADPFDEGSMRISVIAGTGGSFGNRHFVLGGGFYYYVIDGLELGLEGDHAFGGDPPTSKLSPGARYVLHFVPVLKPYIGGFYRHWFIGDDYPDWDTVGARAGAFWVSGGGSFIGGGVVHEVVVSDCNKYCSDTYPEIVLSFSF